MNNIPIRSILMSGGQGDVIMAVLGLIALRESVPQAVERDASVFTRTLAMPIAKVLLPDMNVATMDQAKSPARPRYYTSADTSWSTVIRNWFYPDYYINFAEHRRWASHGQPQPDTTRRLQTWLNSLRLGPNTDWRKEVPVYYGLKMWAPLAAQWDVDTLTLFRACLETFEIASSRLCNWADQLPRPDSIPDVAIFPGAGAYQYIPPELVQRMLSALKRRDAEPEFRCYFAPGDTLIPRYEQAGLPVGITSTVNEILPLLRKAQVVITPDSFVSHLAQLAAPGHVAAMSHDFPVHTLHPAAPSQQCYEAMHCCPCHYYNRPKNELEEPSNCADGHNHCVVYERSAYLQQLVSAVHSKL